MAEWIDELAEALGEEPLSPEETGRLLRASREVAHRVERKNTPLATFLVGATVARKGPDRPGALEDALTTLEGLLPEGRTD